MKQAYFSVTTIDGNSEQFHCDQGGDVDTQVRIIVAALSQNTKMVGKVFAAIIKKYDLTDELKEVIKDESI